MWNNHFNLLTVLWVRNSGVLRWAVPPWALLGCSCAGLGSSHLKPQLAGCPQWLPSGCCRSAGSLAGWGYRQEHLILISLARWSQSIWQLASPQFNIQREAEWPFLTQSWKSCSSFSLYCFGYRRLLSPAQIQGLRNTLPLGVTVAVSHCKQAFSQSLENTTCCTHVNIHF